MSKARNRTWGISKTLSSKQKITLKKLLLEEQNYKCVRCGKELKMSDVTIDHIIPISRGGLEDARNMQLMHQECNLKKADKIMEDNQI